MLSMGFGLSLRMEQKVQVRLTKKQRMRLKFKLATLRMELAQKLHGRQYTPQGECPNCGHKLSPREILEGFMEDPEDTTTECPHCETRFQAHLRTLTRGGDISVRYYCPDQVLHALEGQEEMRPEEISRQNSSVFESARVHFGSLRAAFGRLGITYDHEDFGNWRTKVRPFLGTMPDTHIAEIVGVSASTIGRFRRKEDIEKYTPRDYLDEE